VDVSEFQDIHNFVFFCCRKGTNSTWRAVSYWSYCKHSS